MGAPFLFFISLIGLHCTSGLRRNDDAASLAAPMSPPTTTGTAKNRCADVLALNVSRIQGLQEYMVVAEKYPVPTALTQSLHFFGHDLKALKCYPKCTEPELSPRAKLELRLNQIFDTANNGVTSTVGMWAMIIDLIDIKLTSDCPICDLGSGTGGLMVAFAEMESKLKGTRKIKGVEFDKNTAEISRQNFLEAACLYEELGDLKTAERLRTRMTVTEGDAFKLKGRYSVLNAGFAVAAPAEVWVDALEVGGWIGAPICHDPAYNGRRDAQTLHECEAFFSRFVRMGAADSKASIGTRATLYNGKAYLNATAKKGEDDVPILFVTAPVNV